MTEYLPIIVQTFTILGFIVGAVKWLAVKLSYVNQIPALTSKVEKLENDVTEAIGLKKQVQEIRADLAVLKSEVSKK